MGPRYHPGSRRLHRAGHLAARRCKHHFAVADNGSQDRRRLLDNTQKLLSLGPLLRRDIRCWVCDPASTIPDSLDDSPKTTRLRQCVLFQIGYSVAREGRFVNL